MNIQTLDILNLLFSTPYTTQRTLAKLLASLLVQSIIQLKNYPKMDLSMNLVFLLKNQKT